MAKARSFGVGMDYSPPAKQPSNGLACSAPEIRSYQEAALGGHWIAYNNQFPFPCLIPLEELRELNFSKQYGPTYDPEVFDVLDSISRLKGAKVVAKVYWGDPREKRCDAAEDLKLDSLVVGSRVLGTIKRVLLGNVSVYVATSVSCLVTVVKNMPASSKSREELPLYFVLMHKHNCLKQPQKIVMCSI